MKNPNKKNKNQQPEPPPQESNAQFYSIPGNFNTITSQNNNIQLLPSLPLQTIIPGMMNSDPSSIPGIPSASSIPLAQFQPSFNSKPSLGIPIIGPSQMSEVQPLLINPNVPIDPSNAIPPVMVPSQDWNYSRLATAPPMDPVAIDPPLIQGVNNNSSATNMFIEQWRIPNPWVDPSLLLNPNMPDPYPNLVSQSTSDLTMEDDELKHKRNGRSEKDRAKNLNENIGNNQEVQYNINDNNDNILSLINYIDTQDFNSLTFDELQNIFDTININDILTNNALSEIFSIQDSAQGCTPSSSSNTNGPKPKAKVKPSESKSKLARLKRNGNGDSSDSSSHIAS
ncbi:hypothetical protein CONCODRAFT_5763, partial [Conidiobolus coronatus NRRL 28638]